MVPKIGDHFSYVCGVLNQTIDPPTVCPKAIKTSTQVVFYSPLRRSSECLYRADNQSYFVSNNLKEIPFALNRFITEDDWKKEGSALVRRSFKEAFKTDRLDIKRDKLFEEIQSFLSLCKSLGEKEITAVSHSFRLKIFEAFLSTKSKIVSSPNLIENYIFDGDRTYDFGGGFEIVL